METQDSVSELKHLGNKAFSEGNFLEAIAHFTQALLQDPQNYILYSNRSACYASLQNYQKALEDAEKCVELKPDWSKGHTRKGLAYYYLDLYSESAASYQKALDLDPENSNTKLELSKVQAKTASNPLAELFSGQNLAKMMTNPTTSEYFTQKDFLSMLNELHKDSQMANNCMNDSRFMDCIGVILGMEDGKTRYAQPNHSETSQAEEYKHLGNQAYKRKRYEVALDYYRRALELEPKEVVYINNIAAVYLGLKDYDKCIQLCDQAIQKGRESQADFSKIARAYARKALAQEQKGLIEEAIISTKASLIEHSDPKTKNQLKSLQKIKQQQEEKAYLDPSLARKSNSEATECFNKGEFPKALSDYSEAIKRDPQESTYYTNRAATYMKLMEPNKALEDAESAIQIDPACLEAHIRKGNAHMVLKEYHKAMKSFEEGLKVDPNNQECKKGFQRVIKVISENNEFNNEKVKQALKDPQIQRLIGEPLVSKVLKELGNSTSYQDLSEDPSLRSAIKKLVAAGILKID